jgi:hypothetical protein
MSKLRLGKIENYFLEAKMQIRELIDRMTPEKADELEDAIRKIDSLIKNAEHKYIYMNEIK